MTVLFLHIPKAAGTSYGAALADAIGGSRLVADIPGDYSAEEFQEIDPELLRPHALVAAHVDYGLCRRAPFLRPATVLRDPVDRIVSWYHYVLRDDGHSLLPWRRFIQERRLSVEEFLLHPQLRWLQGQAQTMQIAGYLWSGEPPPYVDDIVPEAAANLAQFTHVGLFERLDDSLRLAQAELGLAAPPTLPALNVSPPREESLDPEVRAEVAGMLGLDSAFYPLAVTEFERRLAAHGLASGTDADADFGSPPTVAPAVVTAPPAGPASSPSTSGPPRVGDSIELAWFPEPGTTVGGPIVWPLPLSAPEAPVVASTGGSLVIGHDAPLDIGANWVRVPAGLYQVQATIPCRRFGASRAEVDWDLLFDFAWYGSPPIPYVEGLPGAPDRVLWVPQSVPPGLPKLPLRGAPVTAGGLLSVPEDGGHLCLLLGSTQSVMISPGDQVRVVYVRLA